MAQTGLGFMELEGCHTRRQDPAELGTVQENREYVGARSMPTAAQSYAQQTLAAGQIVADILDIPYGDVDYDGDFDGDDLNAVGAEYEDSIANNSTWKEGDWNGDREFTSEDLVLANSQ